MFRIDDVHLDASAQRTQRERRQKVSLARTRVPENSDVRARIPPLVEGVDEDRRPRRAVSADHQATRLLQVWFQPGEERAE